MNTRTFKGYLFALIATVAFSNVYIFSKAALNEVHLSQFGIYWCGLGVIFSLLFSLKNQKLKQITTLSKKQIYVLLILGGLEVLATSTFFISVNIIPDPAITSFLGNMFPVFVALGGILILKEKLGLVEISGGLLAIAGTFIISYSGGTSLKTLFIAGTGVVLLNAAFATAATLIVKVHVREMSPELFNLNRYFWLFLFSILMFFLYKQPLEISFKAFSNIGIGAFLEFIAILTVYYSFNYIEASRSAIVQSLKGVFVLIGAYLVFKTLPASHQLIGGTISVLGILIMTLAQSRTKKMS